MKSNNKPDECRIIIGVGSQKGNTLRFAAMLYKQLVKAGEKVYLTKLNKYRLYPKATHLLILTSTYGEGDPPSNASKFERKVITHPQQQLMQFSVVGFGSRSYKHYCQFAYRADHLLRQQPWATPALEVMTVNQHSPQDFGNWLTAWEEQTGFPLRMPRKLLKPTKRKLTKLEVLHKTATDSNGTFLISLQAKQKLKAVSGDLLAVYPAKDYRERLYSIGIVKGVIQLSVKLHPQGLGSGFLNALQAGEKVPANIIRNENFHFPKKAAAIILISNGTGIAPFLGMISENRKKLPVQLYCGFHTRASFWLYQSFLEENIAK